MMSSRRSRLSVKPNLGLRGPKIPAKPDEVQKAEPSQESQPSTKVIETDSQANKVEKGAGDVTEEKAEEKKAEVAEVPRRRSRLSIQPKLALRGTTKPDITPEEKDASPPPRSRTRSTSQKNDEVDAAKAVEKGAETTAEENKLKGEVVEKVAAPTRRRRVGPVPNVSSRRATLSRAVTSPEQVQDDPQIVDVIPVTPVITDMPKVSSPPPPVIATKVASPPPIIAPKVASPPPVMAPKVTSPPPPAITSVTKVMSPSHTHIEKPAENSEARDTVKPTTRVRSRFPKARPNLAEAGRSRIRSVLSFSKACILFNVITSLSNDFRIFEYYM